MKTTKRITRIYIKMLKDIAKQGKLYTFTISLLESENRLTNPFSKEAALYAFLTSKRAKKLWKINDKKVKKDKTKHVYYVYYVTGINIDGGKCSIKTREENKNFVIESFYAAYPNAVICSIERGETAYDRENIKSNQW